MYIPSNYKTYFFVFYGEPQTAVAEYRIFSCGYIQCFVKALDEENAIIKAISEIKKDGWNVLSLYLSPVELPNGVNPLEDKYIDITKNVEKNGLYFVYIGVSRDGEKYEKPIKIEMAETIDKQTFFNEKKKIMNRKKCLHFNAGVECDKIIKSHSIQNHHQLDMIARNSHVYTVNTDSPIKIGMYTLKGIKEMSTFYGFCGKHDNEVFHPIDDYPFSDSDEQAMLYAYRALCKEIHTKQNAYQLIVSGYNAILNENKKEDLRYCAIGQYSGLCSLSKTKVLYDNSLRLKSYSDAHYFLFTFSGKMNIVFSSLIEPDYDFRGNILQDYKNLSNDLQLITYSSVWISNDEWGFLFSWHKEHDRICLKYMKSLLDVYQKASSFSDCLFRLTVVCENSAFSPDWWEALTEQQRLDITDYSNSIIDLYTDLPRDYLSCGLEGICNWKNISMKTNVKCLEYEIKRC